MDSKEFAKSMAAQVAAFCATYKGKPPAYSYVPLTDDAARAKVMKSRLWNEVRAAEVLGSWLKGIPELDVKSGLGRAIAEEFEHADLLSGVLREQGEDPWDYEPLPAQSAMFNAFEAQVGTVERMAAFPLAGEGVAVFMMAQSLAEGAVPEWVQAPYRSIYEEEKDHGGYPESVLTKYALTDEVQARVQRAVAWSLVLRKEYFDSLDRWAIEGKSW
ncbi:MAG: hypothetical protein O3B65_03620 [Chloroflexi bacterium]|nr:hypothetical protein [Chloroflexota bacterium]